MNSSNASTNSNRPQYWPDIDGLRAFAVLSVVIYHASPYNLKGGFIGVDVFFVISGFLISIILYRSLDLDKFSILDFYIRRIKRIFPALLIALAATWIISWFILLSDEYQQLGKHLIGGATFISNFLLWKKSGYFDASAESKPLLHLWSLGIEEQFYIFWPVILLTFWKFRKTVPFILATLICGSFALNILSVEQDPVTTFYLPATRAWELLIGALLAYQTEYIPNFWKKNILLHENVRSAAGIAFLVASLLLIHVHRQFPGYWAIFPTLGAALLISAGPIMGI